MELLSVVGLLWPPGLWSSALLFRPRHPTTRSASSRKTLLAAACRCCLPSLLLFLLLLMLLAPTRAFHALARGGSARGPIGRPLLHLRSSRGGAWRRPPVVSMSSSSSGDAAAVRKVLVAVGDGTEEIEAVTVIDTLVRAGR